MTARFGFILIVVIFGALMFTAGAIAPPSIRTPLETLGKQTMARFSGSPASGKAASASDAASATVPTEAAKAEPVWAEALLIPTPLPEKGQYALQAGQFANADDANALAARIKEKHLPFVKVLDVVDQAGVRSSVVPVGPYASPDEARAARANVARDLALTGPLTLILLPPAAPAAPAASAKT